MNNPHIHHNLTNIIYSDLKTQFVGYPLEIISKEGRLHGFPKAETGRE